jgi:tetratricopeptide (TPR) repeat protein
MAYSLLFLGKLDDALKNVNTAINKDSTDYHMYGTRGEIFIAQKEYERAISDFSQALSLNEYDLDSFGHRAKCYRKLAEAEQDPAKKADLIAKAEADEKKAESLKKGDKV